MLCGLVAGLTDAIPAVKDVDDDHHCKAKLSLASSPRDDLFIDDTSDTERYVAEIVMMSCSISYDEPVCSSIQHCHISAKCDFNNSWNEAGRNAPVSVSAALDFVVCILYKTKVEQFHSAVVMFNCLPSLCSVVAVVLQVVGFASEI